MPRAGVLPWGRSAGGGRAGGMYGGAGRAGVAGVARPPRRRVRAAPGPRGAGSARRRVRSGRA
ncbi:hypothetical protein DDV98_09625 [Streptomyces sp. IB2014 011-12]|nr:hypothetical protein DDV98_09625 [Streptomyces sp. IB2014 011-12]